MRGRAGAASRPTRWTQAANHYVRVRGTPDRESALELDTKGSWVFTQFFRILGTGSRLFVHRRENPLPAVRAEEDRFEGRLIRFADLSFETSIREYTAAHVSATHFFAPDALRRAVAQTPGAATVTVTDLAGDPVLLGPNDLLAIDVTVPGADPHLVPARQVSPRRRGQQRDREARRHGAVGASRSRGR